VWSSRYGTDSGWTEPEILNEATDTGASNPEVASDDQGNAFVVWKQGGALVWRHYLADSGWTEPAEAAPQPAATDLHLSADASGRALVTWAQGDPTALEVWALLYEPPAGWGTAVQLGDGQTGAENIPHGALGPDGAMVAWRDRNNDIMVRAYDDEDGWGTAVQMLVEAEGANAHPRVGIDGSGNAMLLWRHGVTGAMDAYANRYTPTDGWGTPAPIATNSSISTPWLSVSPTGEAFAVWMQLDEARARRVWSNRYTAVGGWGVAAPIDPPGDKGYPYPRVEVIASGAAVAVWAGANDIWANHYVPGNGWRTAQRIETNTPDQHQPVLDVSPTGQAAAIWWTEQPIRVWANVFD